uniref:Sortilin C-terminal domain-containing protein n=1 Tax=Ciona savignyi TaxID=51511 RepID=H2YE23_CIOSA
MWMAVTVDFHAIMGSQCQQTDLTKWTAHETNSVAQSSDGCLLGSKQSFIRRKAGTICTNADVQAIATHKTCECEYTDYLCDYGYKRDESTLECVLDPAAATSNMDVCIEGTEEQIQTKGYRKIPGDKCTGGFVPHHAVKSLSKSCSKAEEIKDNTGVDKHAFVNYVPKSRSNPHTGWIVFLVILVLSLGGSLVYLVYKKRSVLMKVRYRPITQDEPHDDETPNGNLVGTETVIDDDDAVLVSMPNGDHLQSNGAVISYHDDSDEDLLVT